MLIGLLIEHHCLHGNLGYALLKGCRYIRVNKKVIKHKVVLLNLVEELGNVSKVCQVMGLSRDAFYRYKSAVDEGGVDTLFEQSRRKPNLKNRIDPAVEQTLLRNNQ